MAVALTLLLVVFAGLARHTVKMTLGVSVSAGSARLPARQDASGQPLGFPSSGAMLPLALALGLVAAIGFLAGPLRGVIVLAAAALGGTS